MKVYLPLLILTLWASTAYSAAFTVRAPESAAIGQPFMVEVSSDQPLQQVKLTWNERTVELVARPNGDGYTARTLLGMDVLHPPKGPMELSISAMVDGSTRSETRTVAFTDKDYPTQRLKVSKAYVEPSPEALKRIAKESKLVGGVLRTITPGRFWKLPLVQPVDGRVSSVYGLRRFFNDQPRRPHRGLDLAAPAKAPIKAAADGVALLTGKHYFAGNSVYLDHGQGVLTAYFHMNSIAVKQGQVVRAGDVIGTVGKTGRVTGAHLHFGVYVLGQAVDPAPLLKDFPESAP